jgi:phosphoribosyl 1,2-cyclic phosphodiesterase
VDCGLRRTVNPGETAEIGGMEVSAFEIPHDASQPVGYEIRAGSAKACVATDLGHVPDSVKERLAGSDVLLLESNHDLDMLMNGPYPQALKNRISGKRGHLSNLDAGRILAEIMTGRLKRVYLGHLSEENNSPMIAYCDVASALERIGAKIGSHLDLDVAERHEASWAVEI